jgi:hypothetical protein
MSKVGMHVAHNDAKPFVVIDRSLKEKIPSSSEPR